MLPGAVGLMQATEVIKLVLGFSNAGILDIAHVTGYYAYVNRLADGLGVELETFWKENVNDSAT